MCSRSVGLIHKLKIVHDDRDIFKIETFGFVAGGVMNISVSDFGIVNGVNSAVSANANKPLDTSKPKIGFIMRKSTSESAAQQDLEKMIERKQCLLDFTASDDFVVDISDDLKWGHSTKGVHVVEDHAEGLYSLIFVRCSPSGAHKISFNLYAEFTNPGPNYLSAGDTALPAMYFAFFVAFFVALIVWCWVLSRDNATYGTVHRIHYLMATLLVLKCATLIFESIRFHFISITGYGHKWSLIYYFFAFLKGVMLFTVILLIGSGWSMMKSYLNSREKKIVLVVLVLQVLDNIAMVVLEESAPGSQDWLTWRDILHLVDILCCCAILFPIVWSIRHLQQAAEVDGKAQHSLVKLQLFRTFYIIVVAYIYFTRIIVFLIASTIPFYLLWLGAFFTELATLIFYVVTGYQFRPSLDNPYLAVKTDDPDSKTASAMSARSLASTSIDVEVHEGGAISTHIEMIKVAND